MARSTLRRAALFALLAGACDGPAFDNEKTCREWLARKQCDVLSNVDCTVFASQTCDISDYFVCLDDAYVCTGGMHDPMLLPKANSCVTKAACK